MSPADLNIHQRHMLKSKDIRAFIQQLSAQFSVELSGKIITPKSQVEWIKIDNNEEIYAIDKNPAFWQREGKLIPLLSFLIKQPFPFKCIKVDQGAVKFVSNGADVMRPGITFIDDTIKAGDIITVQDPSHGRVLEIGEAMYNAAEMQAMDKGKVVRAVHTLNDPIWAFAKNYK
jgi:PUA domain protein